MLKKALKTVAFMLVLSASISSFIYINSTNLEITAEGVTLEQPDLIPDEHTIVVPAVSIVAKAILIAKGFLYPSE